MLNPFVLIQEPQVTISNSKDNFVDFQPVKDINLSGIVTGLLISGVGTIKWPILTDCGTEVELFIRQTLYVPACPMNLLSPQHLA